MQLCSIDARAPADERTNPQKKVKKNTTKQTCSTRPDQTGNRELADGRTNAPNKVQKNTKKQTLSIRPTTATANYAPRKVFTPGSGFMDHMSDENFSEEDEAPVTRNQLRKESTLEDYSEMETSNEDDEGGETEF